MLVIARSKIGRLALSAALLLMTSCYSRRGTPQVPVQPEVKPAPATPIAEKKEELDQPTWDPEWDVIVETALPPEMLSSKVGRAVRPFCPRFRAMSDVDKRAYWAYVFQALAGAEASLVPTTDVRHTEPEVAVKDTVTRRPVRSEGLLQLTYMDADRYGCDFDWDMDRKLPEKNPAKTILQPKNNLTCGVKILERQIVEKGRPLVSRSSYWSTLQPGTVSYRVFAKQMTNVPKACRVAPLNETKVKTADRTAATLSPSATAAGTK
jgi:hypothetical protein